MRHKQSLAGDVLSILVDRKAPYRIVYRLLEGYYERQRRPLPSHEVLRATLSRLKKNGLVTLKRGTWTASEYGESRTRENAAPWREKALPAKSAKNMIVTFDVPEREKGKRDWLRRPCLKNSSKPSTDQSSWNICASLAPKKPI